MKNPMQLKAIMKNMAAKNHISAQLVLQNYMMERLLERISLTPYRHNLILKGGFLISAIMGLCARATMDMDVTVKNMPLNGDSIREMFSVICRVGLDDGIQMEFRNVSEIREGDEYTGYRVGLIARYGPMAVPLKMDITTGDMITPGEIEYAYMLMMEPRSIQVLAYNLETLLAEKLETILSRGDQNTRPRDFYDVYALYRLRREQVDSALLRKALRATAARRGSLACLSRYARTLESVQESRAMQQHWLGYQQGYEYARGVTFREVCGTIGTLLADLLE